MEGLWRYEGDRVGDSGTGKGVLTYASGQRYEGDVVNFQPSGKGVFTWPNGHRYEGEFVAGKREGKGSQTWRGGKRYEGQFADGKPSGYGVMIDASGVRYAGHWVNGEQVDSVAEPVTDVILHAGNMVTHQSAALSDMAPRTVPASTDQRQKMLAQLDQLDQLDHLDFLDQADKATACIRKRNFDCAEANIAGAAKSVGNSQDRNAMRALKQDLAAERERVAEEERQREEEERRVAQERLREEEQAEVARRQAEADARPSTAELVAQFSAYGLDAYKQHLAAKDATAAVTRQKMAALQEAGRRQEAENQRLITAALQSRAVESSAPVTGSSGSGSRYPNGGSTSSPYQASTTASASDAWAAQQRTHEQEQRRQQAAKEEADRKAAQLAEQEARRQRRAQEEADRKAAQQAEKAAEEQAKKAYLAALAQGIRLKATKCPDGEGKYYVVGRMPKLTIKTAVECIDVHFRASCPDGRNPVNGVAKTFLGMGGCFGDTYDIDPKLSCPVEEVRVEVTDVRGGCN